MSTLQAQAIIGDPGWANADNESQLVERAKCDRDAFAELYRRHCEMLLRHVYRRTGDVHVTEDVVADVFLTALKTLPCYRCQGVPVRFWLLRIATNAVNRWARRQRRHAAALLRLEHLEAVAASPRSPDEAWNEQHAERALLSLPPKYQAVLSLHYFEQLAIKDVAAVIGCRVGTVKSRLARGRDLLREKLNGRR